MLLMRLLFAIVICGFCANSALAVTITDVTLSGSLSDPTITVLGSGFGTTAPAAVQSASYGYTGMDFGPTALSFHDSGPLGFNAGQSGSGGWDTVGLVLSTYTDTQIVFTLGSEYALYDYPQIYAVQPGDTYWVTVAGTDSPQFSVAPEPSSLVLLGSGLSGLLMPLAGRVRSRWSR